jgi:protein-S-isoprenylcysteine O-methyltransferase Ste14
MEKSIIRIVGAAFVGVLAFAGTSLETSPRIAAGVVIGLPSFALIIVGRLHLGKSFAVLPEAKALVTTGLYSRIQHPLYFFLDVFLAALIVALGLPILLLAWGVLVVVHLLQCRREEKVLLKAFGDKYEAYRRASWF